jgi:hypothetical protein
MKTPAAIKSPSVIKSLRVIKRLGVDVSILDTDRSDWDDRDMLAIYIRKFNQITRHWFRREVRRLRLE